VRGTSTKKMREKKTPRKTRPPKSLNLDLDKKNKNKKTGGLGPDHLAHQAEQKAVPGPRGHLGRREQRPRDRLWRGWRERALKIRRGRRE